MHVMIKTSYGRNYFSCSNMLSSSSNYLTDFGLEDLHTRPTTSLGIETNEFKDM